MILLPLLLDPYLSNSRKLYLPPFKSYGPIQSETVVHTFALELRKSDFLSMLQSTIEVLESSIEVSKSFMRCALGTLVHPREMSLFQTIQKFMLFYRVCETIITLIVLVQFDSLVKPPVVGEASDSRMLKKGTSL